VSRRKFIERATAAGVTLAILGTRLRIPVEAPARRKEAGHEPDTPSTSTGAELSPRTSVAAVESSAIFIAIG